jgi:hypothetical protein
MSSSSSISVTLASTWLSEGDSAMHERHNVYDDFIKTIVSLDIAKDLLRLQLPCLVDCFA